MSATEDGSRGVFPIVGRRRRIITAALLVAFAWIGGCAPLWPGQPGIRLGAAVPPGGRLTGALGAPALAGGAGELGGRGGLHATAASELPILLPSGRQYVVHVPKEDLTRPRPLVIALHGMFLTWQNMALTTGLSSYADDHGFLVAYGVGVAQSWNLGSGCCEGAARARSDDVGYLVSIVTDLASRVPIDTSRVYVVGFSTGDSMALFAQCSRPDVFAASAGSSGALLFGCQASRQLRDLHLHGRLDRTVPFGGGWSDVLHRAVPAATRIDTMLKARNPNAIVESRTLPCGHHWPTLVNGCGLDGTDLMWRWVSRFSR